MDDKEFSERWGEFSKNGYVLHRLPEERLVPMFEYLSMRYFTGMEKNKDRYELFLAEINARSATKMAKATVMLAFIAVIVGMLQIFLTLVR